MNSAKKTPSQQRSGEMIRFYKVKTNEDNYFKEEGRVLC